MFPAAGTNVASLLSTSWKNRARMPPLPESSDECNITYSPAHNPNRHRAHLTKKEHSFYMDATELARAINAALTSGAPLSITITLNTPAGTSPASPQATPQNTPHFDPLNQPTEPAANQTADSYHLLVNVAGMSENMATMDLARRRSPSQIREAIAYTRQRNGAIINQAGYIRRLLEKAY